MALIIRLSSILSIVLLSACSQQPIRSVPACDQWLVQLDKALNDADIVDVQTARIEGQLLFRVDRFLLTLRQRVTTVAAEQQWLQHSIKQGVKATRSEFLRLPVQRQTHLLLQAPLAGKLKASLQSCAQQQLNSLQEEQRTAFIASAQVDDVYRDSYRWLGLYPLSRWFVKAAFPSYREKTLARFQQDLNRYDGLLKRYALFQEAAFSPWQTDELGVPLLQQEQQRALLVHFAPMWEVESESDADIPGNLSAASEGPRFVSAPTMVYTHVSYSFWQGKVLPQLNYMIWFSERPGDDMYAGEYDGLMLRLTLDETGKVLLYETVHACGCYYKAYPSPQLRLRQSFNNAQAEPVLSPQSLPEKKQDQVLVVRLQAGTHYVSRLYFAGQQRKYAANVNYSLQEYDVLRTLMASNGQAYSLFDQSGLVPGSQRAERWLLWPMGVPSAGAMRQWGHHAIAFVGKRMFDDPLLLEQFFQPGK